MSAKPKPKKGTAMKNSNCISLFVSRFVSVVSSDPEVRAEVRAATPAPRRFDAEGGGFCSPKSGQLRQVRCWEQGRWGQVPVGGHLVGLFSFGNSMAEKLHP